jgi:lipid-A-disaccharide synthase-like uncharacterized protein
VKWEAVVVMVILIVLGMWLVNEPHPEAEEGATLVPLRIGDIKGWVEVTRDEAEDASNLYTFRILPKGAERGDVVSEAAMRGALGDDTVDRLITFGDNSLFRLLNITSWIGVIWVVIGFGAQAVFAARFMVQWIVSEKRQESVVPEVFWWISITGGIMLYCYFVWRKDLPAVLGQSTGIVIYARNLRLISKGKKRQALENESAEKAEG